MQNSDWGNWGRAGLTRISVTGTNNGFVVRTGDGRARLVRRAGERLICECGGAGCEHVEAVVLCGFVEEQPSGAQKAA